MIKKTSIFTLLLVLGLLLAACGGDTAPAEVAVEEAPPAEEAVEEAAPEEPAEEAAEEPAEEMAEEPAEEPAEESAVDLDESFEVFLDDMEGYNTIGIDALNEMIVEGDAPFLLDVREPGELEEKGWIEGAANIPLREVAANVDALPAFDETIVSYCGSGWRCTIALTALEAMGWEDVKGLKGGSFGGWIEAGYPFEEGEIPAVVALDAADPDPAMVAEMDEMLSNVPEGFGGITAEQLNTEIGENPDLILIDVRTAGEVEEKGYIDAPNVTFIPLEEFVADKDMWPEDLDSSIVIYCGSGHRSTIAMSILWSYGYSDVRSLKGGYGGWAAGGYPTIGAPEMSEEASILDEPYQIFLDDMEGYNTIGIDAVNEMIAEENAPFLLDVREPGELEEKGWIEGAVNIPLREVGANVNALPAFDETIVSYCGSGWRCTIALTALEAMGWEDVKGLKGGSYGGWVEAGYPIVEGEIPAVVALDAADPDPALVAEMDEMLSDVPEGFGVVTAEQLNTEIGENPDLILIDVRTAGEVEEKGSIDAPNVTFIPLEEFVADKDMWPEDLDATIAVYCGSGHRSTIAMSILWSYGYTDVRSLKGGYGGWAADGYPTVGGSATAEEEGSVDMDGAFEIFLADMAKYNTIGLDDLNLALAEDPPPYLLDVREPSELEANGYIEGAVNIPLREVADHIELLPSFDTPIVSYCGSGWRCTIALTALEAMGWEDVTGLKGGSFGGWVEDGYPAAEGLPLEAMVLDVAEPDPAMVAATAAWLHEVPEGFGGISADDLNAELIENPDLILIDVRTDGELEEKGIIEAENWLHIPLEEFIAEKDMWPEELDAPIVVYCGSGHRSTIAMSILWAYGYDDVQSLKGGFGGWVEAGYPVVEYAMP